MIADKLFAEDFILGLKREKLFWILFSSGERRPASQPPTMLTIPLTTFELIGLLHCLFDIRYLLTLILIQILLKQKALQLHEN
jgi:hypothetical protein